MPTSENAVSPVTKQYPCFFFLGLSILIMLRYRRFDHGLERRLTCDLAGRGFISQ